MNAPSLADLQSAMQAAVLDGAAASPDWLAQPRSRDGSIRLKTYQNAYLIRLVGILRGDFDMLWTWMGDDQFDELALAYIRACPSKVRDARWFADRLPGFAANTAPWSQVAAIGDLAELQWSVGKAFDAADAPMADLNDLASVAPDTAAALRLELHPAVSLLTQGSNAAEILSALRAEETPPPPETLEAPRTIMVWRRELTARYAVLDEEEAMLALAARDGADFAMLCDMAAMRDDPDTAAMRVASTLRQWLQNGVISRIVAPSS